MPADRYLQERNKKYRYRQGYDTYPQPAQNYVRQSKKIRRPQKQQNKTQQQLLKLGNQYRKAAKLTAGQIALRLSLRLIGGTVRLLARSVAGLIRTFMLLPAPVQIGAVALLGIYVYLKTKDGDIEPFESGGYSEDGSVVDFNGYYEETSETNKIKNKIIAEAKAQGVDPNLALAVAQQESGFNPKAKSQAGACGIFQLMPQTAKEMGVSDPFNVDQNIKGGIKYLKWCLKNTNTIEEALVAYNAGLGNLRKAQKAGKPIDSITDHGSYAKSVMGRMEKFKTERSKLPSKYYNAKGGGQYGTWNGKRITSPIGKRHVTDAKGNDIGASTFHKGIDIAFSYGEPVYAYTGGKVTLVGTLSGFGNTIIIDDARKYRHVYAHLSKFNVTKGQTVKKGALIGYAGNSGIGSGAHLHYGIWKPGGTSDSAYIDPRLYQYVEDTENDTSGTPKNKPKKQPPQNKPTQNKNTSNKTTSQKPTKNNNTIKSGQQGNNSQQVYDIGQPNKKYEMTKPQATTKKK